MRYGTDGRMAEIPSTLSNLNHTSACNLGVTHLLDGEINLIEGILVGDQFFKLQLAGLV